MKTHLISFIILLAATQIQAQVSISLQAADQAAIPGSRRQLYAAVEGSANLEVRWAATGGCTLAAPITSSFPQTVTAPAAGGKCSVKGGQGTATHPSFSSPVSCTITATSAADPARSDSMVIPVCAPAVLLTVFPSSAVLFKEQPAVIQSDLRGSVNTAVRWTISANPGNAGHLEGGDGNRHAVFSAGAPGTYVLTATSVANPQKKAAVTLYVTPHPLPSPNADHTEAVDCTAVTGGRAFEVGPARQYRDLNGVPWNSLKAGDTVRIHNDDTTGKDPTTYHQHVAISTGGSAARPVRVCGVADEHGVKPIVDGENATSPPNMDWASGYLESAAVILLYDGFHKYDDDLDQQQNVLIEGLHVRNASSALRFQRTRDHRPVRYSDNSACIAVQTGRGITLRGNELEHCNQGIFANSQTPAGSVVQDLTVEGNSLHDWGVAESYLVHGMYLQAIGLTVQFNAFGPSVAGAIGNLVKTRSVMNFLRWNYMSEPVALNARAFDMVEPQDFDCYVTPHGFRMYHSIGRGNNCIPPHDGPDSDRMTADQVAANFEAYHADYVYGNVMDDAGSEAAFVHYGYDQQTDEGPGFNRRGGMLYYWSNTHLYRKPNGLKLIYDSAAPDQGHSYEFPVLVSVNNIFAAGGTAVFQWQKPIWSRAEVDSNWIKSGYALPNRDSVDSFQGGLLPEERSGCRAARCRQTAAHMVFARRGVTGQHAETLYQGTTPFDLSTYRPTSAVHGLAAQLPAAVQDQPSNMQYFPATNVIAPRRDASFLGALD